MREENEGREKRRYECPGCHDCKLIFRHSMTCRAGHVHRKAPPQVFILCVNEECPTQRPVLVVE